MSRFVQLPDGDWIVPDHVLFVGSYDLDADGLETDPMVQIRICYMRTVFDISIPAESIEEADRLRDEIAGLIDASRGHTEEMIS
jgi:hypothetical protein